MTNFVEIPRIEDEIEEAWADWCRQPTKSGTTAGNDSPRANFEAGFRAARTFTQTGGTVTVQAGS